MKYFNNSVLFLSVVIVSLFYGCEKVFDHRPDTDLTEEQALRVFNSVRNLGYNVYHYVPDGFNRLDGAFLAAATDEAEHSWDNSAIRMFNEGTWSPNHNPDDNWRRKYEGIRAANLFLEKSADIASILVPDTFTPTDMVRYQRNYADMEFLRAEVRFLRAYFHFELLKRYGGVPIVTRVLGLDEGLDIPRSSYHDVIQFVVSECDSVKSGVLRTFQVFDNTREGRVTRGTVLSLKSRALLYAASPLNNPGNDIDKWQASAIAAHDVIALNQFRLDNSYRALFIAPRSFTSNEVIWAKRYGETNMLERANYPIGTDGGRSGSCPSHNLVKAYEKLPGWTEEEPYEMRDPRLRATVVVNNSTWNGRKMEIWQGGRDGKRPGIEGPTKTGYYLKKFLADSLVLGQNQTTRSSWIIFRYAETLLNYAESVNEGYPFDARPEGMSMTARQALNLVRARSSMPPVEAANQEEMRERIRHERRIELAFEEHRAWDVRRWKIAEETLGAPLLGIDITLVNDSLFDYREVQIEHRIFQPKMYLYPIPLNELIKYNGAMEQNPEW